ncbi:hypothetical protein [Natrialba swarupiae]|uniref:Uncharacterized protein n=1 Tax=Natrialba swarupiae TaxID=2448032 RepID=A0A5D5AN28_9EURY|nr:hypothetical protein [Natrialba swarupiae]TYT63249.1 hypothetical protein FYC77_04040 [Natrialba swarupiae]
MTPPSERLPTETAGAVALAAVVGTVALSLVEPTTAVGTLAGGVLAATLLGFGRSHRHVVVRSALVAVVVLGTVGTAGAVGEPIAIGTMAVGVVIGIGLCGALAGPPEPSARRRAGLAAFVTGALTAGLVPVALGVELAGGVGAALSSALWVAEPTVTGLVSSILLGGLAAALAVIAVPPAMCTVPQRRERYITVRRSFVASIAIATAVTVAAVLVVAMLTALTPLASLLLEVLVGSSLVRALCLLVTVVGAGVACLGFVVRRAWSQTTARSDATVAILAGTGVGTVTPFLAALAVGETVVTATELTALYGVTALVLGVTLIVAPWYGEVVRADGPVGPTALLAGSLVLGAVVVAATAEATAFLVGVAALLALTAACFVYDVGRYGRTIALEIGSIGVDRRPQLVRIAWSGALGVVAVPVGVAGLWIATVLAPTLSVPATIGVFAGLAAVGVGAWVLWR